MSYWLKTMKGLTPKGPGVYVVYDKLGTKVTYVGSSRNVYARLRAYKWLKDDAVVKVKWSRRLGDYRMEEERLLIRLKPPGNWKMMGRVDYGAKVERQIALVEAKKLFQGDGVKRHSYMTEGEIRRALRRAEENSGDLLGELMPEAPKENQLSNKETEELLLRFLEESARKM